MIAVDEGWVAGNREATVKVTPAFTHKSTAIDWRWWVQLAGHVLIVGTPIVWGIVRAPRMAGAP